jgi:predicted transcriptional regulator
MTASLRDREAQHRYAGFDTPDESPAYCLLRAHPKKWISQRQVENATRMSRSAANRHLLSLFRGGVIERARSKRGNYWIYRVVV